MLEDVSAEYEGDIAFVAVGGASDRAKISERAGQWIPSGRIQWGLDEDQDVWALFGARGTPTTVVLAADGRVVAAWAGEASAEGMRQAIELAIVSG